MTSNRFGKVESIYVTNDNGDSNGLQFFDSPEVKKMNGVAQKVLL